MIMAPQGVKTRASHMMRVEIEIDRLDHLDEALDEGRAVQSC